MNRRVAYLVVLIIALTLIFTAFQRGVNYWLLKRNKAWVSYTIKIAHDDTLAIYYNDGNGFTPEKNEYVVVKGKNEFQAVRFPVIYTKQLSILRFDFGRFNPTFEVKDVSVKSATNEIQLLRDKKRIDSNQITRLTIQDELLKGKIEGSDPFLIDNTPLNKLNLAKRIDQDESILIVFYIVFSLVSIWSIIKRPFYNHIHIKIRGPQLLFLVLFGMYISIHYVSITTGIFSNNFALEKRNPEAFPKTTDTAKVEKFNKWITDRFALRQSLTRSKSLINYYVFQNSSLPDKVLIGKNKEMFSGMFFLNDDYQGKMKLEEIQWKSIRKNLLERLLYCEQHGMKYYLLLNPNKQTIYSSFMPASFQKRHAATKTLLNQIRSHIEKDPVLKEYIVFSADTLQARTRIKPKFHVFHKHDLHWNGWGAFYAYQQLMLRVQKDFSELKPYPRNRFNVHAKFDSEGDLSRGLLLHDYCKRCMYYFEFKSGKPYHMYETMGKNSKPLFRTIHLNKKLPKLLVFRDSYCQDLIQFTSLHFSEATYVWDQEFDLELIQEKKPDIVLQEIAELFVYDLLRVNPKAIQREIN